MNIFTVPIPNEQERERNMEIWKGFEYFFCLPSNLNNESEEWSSQWLFQFKQLERRSLKKKKKKSGLQRDALPTEVRWSPDFFQASSFQLLKLKNSLRWSFFTLFLVYIAYKTHFPGPYRLKKEVSKVANFRPKPWTNPFWKFPKELVHGFCWKLPIFPSFSFREYGPGKCVLWYSKMKKMSIFGLFELPVFIAEKDVFTLYNIIKHIFLGHIT